MKTDDELIAEFMGFIDGGNFWTSRGKPYIIEDPPGVFHNPRFYPYELKFDVSWDWLMPVVEKIHIAFSIHSTQCKSIEMALFRLDKQGLYMAVVEFIKWHNKQAK